MPQPAPASLTIWALQDGRPGHQNQVLGLAEAVSRQVTTQVIPVELGNSLRGTRVLWPGATRALQSLPKPDLIIGAGHRSHVPLLVLRRRFGGQSVVLMRPALPQSWFDLCFVSDTDRPVPENDRVIRTRGVLNRMQPSASRAAGEGLILVGGPARHFQWHDQQVAEQVRSIVERSSETSWQIATSRRTPDEFYGRCREFGCESLIVRPDDVDSHWLPQQLSRMESTWVTQDSMSMTFEALTAGCRVGVIELEPLAETRVSRRARALAESGDVTRWSDWQQTGMLGPASDNYREADRCAEVLLQHLGSTSRRQAG